jgi:hypothetical protein
MTSTEHARPAKPLYEREVIRMRDVVEEALKCAQELIDKTLEETAWVGSFSKDGGVSSTEFTLATFRCPNLELDDEALNVKVKLEEEDVKQLWARRRAMRSWKEDEVLRRLLVPLASFLVAAISDGDEWGEEDDKGKRRKFQCEGRVPHPIGGGDRDVVLSMCEEDIAICEAKALRLAGNEEVLGEVKKQRQGMVLHGWLGQVSEVWQRGMALTPFAVHATRQNDEGQ